MDYSGLIQKMAETVLKKIDPARPTKTVKSPGAREVAPEAADELTIKTEPSVDSRAPFEVTQELTPPPEFIAPTSRPIPSRTRREIWQRDEGQCTHTLSDGTRCPSRFALEIDHIIPWAYGGTHLPENLRLLCRAHHRVRGL
jgi:hypothetical protein